MFQSNLNPNVCVNPLATNLALYISTLPSGKNFILKSHLQSTICWLADLGTNSQVWLDSMADIYVWGIGFAAVAHKNWEYEGVKAW